MSSIDKLALTSRLLYDERVIEQRKEIERLKVKLFFRDYTEKVLIGIMQRLNYQHAKCKCSGCKATGRLCNGDIEDKEAACTFGPCFDKVLKEHGLVVLRKYRHDGFYVSGPYIDEFDTRNERFAEQFTFSDEDCDLVEMPHNLLEKEVDDARWENIIIGKRLWNAESVSNECIKQFKRVFN